MRARGSRSIVAVAVAAAMTFAACGGGDDDAEDPASTDDEASADSSVDAPADAPDATDGGTPDGGDDETGDGGDEAAPSGDFPVDGAVVTVLDVGLGVYAIDRTDGSTAEFTLAGDDATESWFADRNAQPIGAGDRAYTLLFLEGEDFGFVEDVALGELDLTAGTVRVVSRFGPPRETAESTDFTNWKLIGADGGVAWLERSENTAEGSVLSVVSVDVASGEVTSDTPTPMYEETYDGGTCSSELRGIGVDSTGQLVVTAFGVPGTFDPGTGEATLLVPCSEDVPSLVELADDPTAFAITPDGATLSAEGAERMLDIDVDFGGGRPVVVGDDAIWWVFQTSSSFVNSSGEEENAIIGGIGRVDRTTGEFAVFPVGEHLGEYVRQIEGGGFEIATLGSAELQVVGDDLWIMDRRDNGELLRLDPATGTVDAFEIPLDPVGLDPDPELGDGPRGTEGVGSRRTEAALLRTDPDGIWLEVTRWVISEEDPDGGRSSSGHSYIDQVDPATGEVVRSIDERALTGFEF